jgi:geranylgeranyl diphosphate synthase type II
MWVAEYKERIEHRLIELLEHEQDRAPSIEARLLLSRISSLILRGGKRFRPALLFTTYESYGGKNSKSLVNLGLALELYHQALLVHDDIIDEDVVRYDGPNIVGYYDQDKRFKNTSVPSSMGILAGDMLFTLSNKVILNDQNLTLKQKTKILNIIGQTNLGVIYGQQLDSINIGNKINDHIEKKMILINSLKSALYTTQLPMRLAAILLDIPKAEVDRIDKFSLSFGIYFQLVDDYNDYFPTDTAFDSRPKFRDYPEAKITYPYFVGLKLTSPSKRLFLEQNFGDKQIAEEAKTKVVEILKNCGADEASRIFAEHYYSDCMNNLKVLEISEKRKSRFKQMIDDIKI